MSENEVSGQDTSGENMVDQSVDMAAAIENDVEVTHEIASEAAVENQLPETSEGDAATQPVKDSLILNDNGDIIWNEVKIAKLEKGVDHFNPKITLIGDELNREETKDLVFERLELWLNENINRELSPLLRLKKAIDFVGAAPSETEVASDTQAKDEVSAQETPATEESPIEQSESPEVSETTENSETPIAEVEAAPKAIKPKPAPKALTEAAKNIAIIIYDNHGCVARNIIANELSALSQDNRRELRNCGVRFGRKAVYLPFMLKPKSARLNAILGSIFDEVAVFLPPFGVTSFEVNDEISAKSLNYIGFVKLGTRAVRYDIADRVLDTMFDAFNAQKTPIALPIAVVSLLGVSTEVAESVVANLGWEKSVDEESVATWKLGRPPRPPRRPMPKTQTREENADQGAAPRPKRDFTSQGYGKKRKDAPNKIRTKRDYSAGPNNSNNDKNQLSSPFAILAQLKDKL